MQSVILYLLVLCQYIGKYLWINWAFLPVLFNAVSFPQLASVFLMILTLWFWAIKQQRCFSWCLSEAGWTIFYDIYLYFLVLDIESFNQLLEENWLQQFHFRGLFIKEVAAVMIATTLDVNIDLSAPRSRPRTSWKTKTTFYVLDESRDQVTKSQDYISDSFSISNQHRPPSMNLLVVFASLAPYVPPFDTRFVGQHKSNGILIGSAIFAWLRVVANRLTDSEQWPRSFRYLPDYVISAESLPTFQRQLKRHLFCQSFPGFC